MSGDLVIVAGDEGFIGGHLVAQLIDQRRQVRPADGKPLEIWHQVLAAVDNRALEVSPRCKM